MHICAMVLLWVFDEWAIHTCDAGSTSVGVFRGLCVSAPRLYLPQVRAGVKHSEVLLLLHDFSEVL